MNTTMIILTDIRKYEYEQYNTQNTKKLNVYRYTSMQINALMCHNIKLMVLGLKQ